MDEKQKKQPVELMARLVKTQMSQLNELKAQIQLIVAKLTVKPRKYITMK